ncbi:MAG: tetratricopeptide repeat protein [Holophagales bacterium]|nr:tetratricopeptide repeat protein [Holophagales bacterium]
MSRIAQVSPDRPGRAGARSSRGSGRWTCPARNGHSAWAAVAVLALLVASTGIGEAAWAAEIETRPADQEAFAPSPELEAAWAFVRAKLLADEGDHEGALAAYQRAVELDGDDAYNLLEAARYHTYLSQISRSRQQQLSYLEQGLLYIDRARQIDADNTDVLELYAQIHMRMVDEKPASLALAQGALEHLRDLEPSNLTALTSLGQIYLWSQESEKAVEVLRDATRYASGNRMIQSMLVEALMGTGNSADAEKALEYLVELEPEDSESRIRLAELYSDRGEHSAAVEVLEQAPEGDWFGAARIRQVLAREYHLAGRNEEALELTDEMMAETSGASAAEGFLRLRAAVLSALIRYDEAIEAFLPVIEVSEGGRRTQDLLLLGRLYERVGRVEEASRMLSAEVESGEASSDAGGVDQIRLALAGMYQRGGDLGRAELWIRPVAEGAGQGPAVAAQALAEIREQDGRLADALAGLESAAAAQDAAGETDLARALDLRRAVTLAEAEQWTALEGLARSLTSSDVAGASPAARQLLAEAMAGQGRLDRALELLDDPESAATAPPEGEPSEGVPSGDRSSGDGSTDVDGEEAGPGADPAAEEVRAPDRRLRAKRFQLLFEHGREEQARAELAELARSEDPGELFFAARMYQSQGMHAQAVPLLERIVSTEPERLDAVFALGAAYERSGQHAEAESTFEGLLAERPGHPATLNYLGYMWAERGENLRRAHEMIREAVAKDPDNGAYVDSLGWVLFQMGAHAEARPHLEWAARLESTDPTVHEHLGDLYVALGEIGPARAAYEKALEHLDDDEAAGRLDGKIRGLTAAPGEAR